MLSVCFCTLSGKLGAVETQAWRPVFAEEGPELRHMIGFSGGAGLGTLVLGGKLRHDLAFLNVHYGYLLERTFLEDTFLAGRLMILGEGTVGREFRPGQAWAFSVTPLAHYHFETQGRWAPFVEGGYGVTWTDIGKPDLGGKFQFNGQIGGGIKWFVRPELAYTLQYRFLHYSNAGARSTNRGVNVNILLVGVSYFY